VEVPEVPRVMLVGDRVQIRPLLGETEVVRLTVPVKLFCAVTVIVEVPDAPARTVTIVGFAVTVYGVPELTGTTALPVRPTPVPVTFTLKVPGAEELQDRGEAPVGVPPLTVTLVGDRVQARPVDGEIDAVRVTVPANPLRDVTVMPEVPVPPDGKPMVAGFAVTVKS